MALAHDNFLRSDVMCVFDGLLLKSHLFSRFFFCMCMIITYCLLAVIIIIACTSDTYVIRGQAV